MSEGKERQEKCNREGETVGGTEWERERDDWMRVKGQWETKWFRERERERQT